MDKIEKIRQEIERRYAYQKEMYNKTKPDGRPNDGWAESLAIMGVLEELLTFLDTLSEEPDNDASLESTASYDTQQYTPRPSVGIEDVARVQFASHVKVFDKKRKAVFDWEQFKEVVSIFYGFGKKDSSETKEKGQSDKSLEEAAEEWCKRNNKGIALCADKKSHYLAEGIDAFIAGAEWQKERDTRDMIMSDGSYFQKCYELGKKDAEKEINKELIKAMEKVHEIRDVDYDIHVDTSADDSFETISYYENGKLVAQERRNKKYR